MRCLGRIKDWTAHCTDWQSRSNRGLPLAPLDAERSGVAHGLIQIATYPNKLPAASVIWVRSQPQTKRAWKPRLQSKCPPKDSNLRPAD